MTVDIQFGKLVYEDGEEFVDWPGIYLDGKTLKKIGYENDGTSEELTIFSGRPLRSFSTHGFYKWVESIPQAKMILDLCKPKYPNTNDRETRVLDKALLNIINLLPENGEPIDIDRATWFKYWSKRAIEEFGKEACISIF